MSRGRRCATTALAGAAVAVGLTGLGACSTGTPDDGASSTPTSAATESPEPVDVAELGGTVPYAEMLFEATNAARAAEGLAGLTASTCAQEQGGLRAAALVASGGELVHAPMGPVSASCDARAITGENLSRAAVAPGDVVDAWMASPGHRSNILDPAFTEMGISCVVMPADPLDEALCSQVFLGP